jgi:hypothetical protein
VTARIWDTFLFAGELDLLELRLRHLDGLAHRHVIAEATTTFGGQPKPLIFPAHAERFAPWADRIVYIPVDDLPHGPVPWAREHAQRDALGPGMEGSWPRDLVLLGDVDEIPDRPTLAGLAADPPLRPVVLEMSWRVFAVDWCHPRPGLNTVVMSRWQLESFSKGPIRDKKRLARIFGGGWHLSWLGGPEAIDAKAAAHAHQELSPMIRAANAAGRLYEVGWCPWDGLHLQPADVDATWPEAIWKREVPPVWFRPRP